MQIIPDITICTVVKEQPFTVKSMLRSLYETADPVAIDVIVVDTSGSGKAAVLQKDFPDIKHFEVDGDQSDAQSMNHGIRLAKGRYIGLFDHNVIFEPKSLKIIIDFMDDTPDVGICGPRVVNAFGRSERSVRSFNTLCSLLAQYTYAGRVMPDKVWKDKFAPQGSQNQAPYEVDWLCSGVHIVRQEVIEEIGGLDEEYLLGQEEEYYLRARRKGWHNYYIYQAKVIHPNPLKYMVAPASNKFSPKMFGCAWKFFTMKWKW